ncbi:DUF2141 domain-containing protein [Lutibacter sp.]
MEQMIKNIIITLILFTLISFNKKNEEKTFSLTVKVTHLRNSKGVVQFALYNKEGSIPDEKYKKYYLKDIAPIKENSSTITFSNLPQGKYAINILHDENKNGKIDKGFILPKEGIGFSNYQSIGIRNRPKFSKASFMLNTNTTKEIKVIYF